MSLTPDQIADFTKLTLNKFEKNSWVDLSLSLQNYYGTSKIFQKHKALFAGGANYEWQLQVSTSGNARFTGMYAVDQTAVSDVMVSATVPFRKLTGNYSYCVDEDAFQSGPETIIRLLKVREHDCLAQIHNRQETAIWSSPSSSSDTNAIMGIPHWIVKDATTTPGGAFNGGNPTGFSSGAAGVSSSTYSAWKNWTFGYTNVTRDDFVARLNKAAYKTNFQNPHSFAELGKGADSNWSYCTTFATLDNLKKLLEGRNDNLGFDLSMPSNPKYMGNPFIAVAYLDENDSSDPVYGINWNTMKPCFKSGWDMKRCPPKEAPNQHGVYTVHIDTWEQIACFNRRENFVGSTS